MKVPMIYQMENSECGLACCAMILNYFKYIKTQLMYYQLRFLVFIVESLGYKEPY